MRPRPARPFSSIHSTPRVYRCFRSTQLAERELPSTSQCSGKAKQNNSTAATDPKAARCRRGGVRPGGGEEGPGEVHATGGRGRPCWAPGVRQPEPASCARRPRRASGLGPREPISPREDVAQAPPRPPPPSAPRPRVLSSGLGDTPRSGRCPHPPPSILIHSTPPSPARGRSQCQSCEIKKTGIQNDFKVPSNCPDFSAKPQNPVEEPPGAQITGMSYPARALGSLQALRSAPVSRCVHPLASGVERLCQGRGNPGLESGKRLRCRRGPRQELPATRWRQRPVVSAHPSTWDCVTVLPGRSLGAGSLTAPLPRI